MNMKNHLSIWFGMILLGLIGLAALVGAVFFAHAADQFDLNLRLAGPDAHAWFGRDEDGRNLFGLVLLGAQVSLVVGIITVAISAAVGTLFGLTAGYLGGNWDRAFVVLTDLFLAFPSILFAIAIAAFVQGQTLWTIIFILSFVGWVSYARIVRGEVLSLREREYVQSALLAGAGLPRIFWRHLLPNVMGPILINATFGMAGIILAESTLSFLGLGVPVGIPSWGRLMDQGVQYLLVAPHLSLFPGLAIMLTILGFNFLGDGLRDWLARQ